MVRTCVWCDAPLPEPEHKGHRRREFCNPPKTCKQQHYLWHKKMKEDAAKLSEPYWRTAYIALVEQFKALEQMLQTRNNELAEEREHADQLTKDRQYYKEQIETLRVDYIARLKALNLSEQDIKEFDEYWKRQIEPFGNAII